MNLLELKDLAAALDDCERLIVARPRSAQGWYMKAKVFVDLHDRESALAAIKRAAEVDPGNAESYAGLGWIRFEMEDRERAVENISRAIELNPDRIQYLRLRARFHTRMREFEPAVADAREAVAMNPESWDSYRELFRVLRAKIPGEKAANEPEVDVGARAELRAALEELASRAEGWVDVEARARAYREIASNYRELKDHDRAMETVNRAVDTDPGEFLSYLYRMLVWRELGEMDAVRADCEAAARIELDTPQDLRMRGGWLLRWCNDPDQVLEDHNRVVELAPHWADAYWWRGRLYHSRSEHAKALEDFDRAIDLAPAWTDAYRYRGLTLKQQKRFEEAMADFDRVIEMEPFNVDAVYNRALVFMALERFEEALTDFDWCLERQPRGSNSLWNRAWTLLSLGRPEEALAAADKTIELYPTSDFAMRLRATMLWFLGRVDETLAAAERAIEHSPSNGQNHLYRGIAAIAGAGSCESGLADLELARKLTPGDPEIASTIAWVHAVPVFRRCPELFDVELALDLAREAVESRPNDAWDQNALGIVLYRDGRLREAREALLRAAEIRLPKPQPWELFELAMVEWRLGREREARDYYDRAVVRMNETHPLNPDYVLLREEAAELLGIRL